MLNKIKSYLRHNIRPIKPVDHQMSIPMSGDKVTVKRLTDLSKRCAEYLRLNPVEKSIRILIPTTFNLSKSWWAHDGIIALALKLRGVDVITTMCDRIQLDECMLWSGVWQKSGETGFAERRNKYCEQCIANDLSMANAWGLKPVRLSSYITDQEREETRRMVNGWISAGDWESLTYKDYPIGREAWKAVVNNDLQAEIEDWWRERADRMAFHHLYNICVLMKAYGRLLDVMSVDRIFGNGGHYYTWGALQHIAEQKKISYHRYYKNWASHPLGWNYASNSHHLVDLMPAWESWLEQEWDLSKESRIVEHFKNRGLHLADGSVEQRGKELKFKGVAIDPSKPTLLVPTGVAWDAYTNQPGAFYGSMCEWLWELFDWFNSHPEYQAVIRVHPMEGYSKETGSNTRIYVEGEIKNKNILVPDNVIVVPAKHSLSTYDLIPIADVAAVYTSTTGLELACAGLPVISVGPSPYRGYGISYDPQTSGEYYDNLERLLKSRGSYHSKEKILRAKKFWYLWAYHSTIITGLLELDGTDNNGLHVLRDLDVEDLLPESNKYLDYILDSLINDLPFMGPHRWPPERDICYDQHGISF